MLCEAGTTNSLVGATACTPVLPGTYAPVKGLAAPVACPVNQYSTDEGAVACKTCPWGTVSVAGSTSRDDCVPTATTQVITYSVAGFGAIVALMLVAHIVATVRKQ